MDNHQISGSDDPIAALFAEPPQTALSDKIIFSIVPLDARHWSLRRSDNHGGGIFSTQHAALREAQDEAARLGNAGIVIIRADEPRSLENRGPAPRQIAVLAA